VREQARQQGGLPHDNWSVANAVARPIVEAGGDSWYFVAVDYAFGKDMEEATNDLVRKAGGKVLGSVRHPLGTTDYASFLLQAQSLQ
jgi:branched-chain amino acid transport system substrate-binding protein